jgi:hypothetical protein
MNDNATHPLKELEIVLNAGVFHLDSGVDGGTDNACECLRTATEILNGYFEALGFDDSGRAPVGFEEMERLIMKRKELI